MKIALFTENYYCGGLDSFIINLINYWPKDEDEIILMCNHNHPGINTYEKKITRPYKIMAYRTVALAGLSHRIKYFGLRHIIVCFCRYLTLIYSIFALRKVLFECSPDKLMVINGGYPGGDSCRAATICWGVFNGNKKSYHNFHGFAQFYGRLSGFIERLIDKYVIKYTLGMITVSKKCANSLKVARSGFLGSNKIYVIYNGIGEENNESVNVDIRKELNISEKDKICTMLATYHAYKGHDFVLRAFKKVRESMPESHLVICGDGDKNEVDIVKELVGKYALESSVHLLEFRNDSGEIISRSDVVVIPSQKQESFCLVSLEAWQKKKPVVATDVGGIPEVIVNGEGGFIVACDDVDGFASNIIKLFKDVGYATEQGCKGYERHKKYFTADRMAGEYAKLIRN